MILKGLNTIFEGAATSKSLVFRVITCILFSIAVARIIASGNLTLCFFRKLITVSITSSVMYAFIRFSHNVSMIDSSFLLLNCYPFASIKVITEIKSSSSSLAKSSSFNSFFDR